MLDTQSLIAELDTALSEASDSRHRSILRSVTDLFLDNPDKFSGDHVAVFDDVIIRLIEKTEHSTLIELSNRLAPVGNAPANVVIHLSRHDDIAVSGPVLEQSDVLTDETLGEVAKTKSQKHLAAIAGRRRIDEAVTDLLVERGNSDVACKVTGNRGARFSEPGFVKLVKRAKNDRTLAAAVEFIELPVAVIVHLSHDDDIAISGPILEKSEVLTDETLAEVARAKGQQHLAAIAGRAQIGESVTDIVAERGSPEVARILAGNQGARLSELGFVKLINQSKKDKVLAAAIAKRKDIPPELEPFLKLALA